MAPRLRAPPPPPPRSPPHCRRQRHLHRHRRQRHGERDEQRRRAFVLSGNVPRTLLIRGIGPTLAAFGVTGALANPRLERHRTVANRDTTVATNAGWGGAPALRAAFAQVGAFALPAASADAAILITLTPGSYTAQVAGAGNTTGVALVELYEVP